MTEQAQPLVPPQAPQPSTQHSNPDICYNTYQEYGATYHTL